MLLGRFGKPLSSLATQRLRLALAFALSRATNLAIQSPCYSTSSLVGEEISDFRSSSWNKSSILMMAICLSCQPI
jgi:hypothetical protein